MNSNLLRLIYSVLTAAALVFSSAVVGLFANSSSALATTVTRVNPCLEEARLAAVTHSMDKLRAGNAVDPKVYEERDPELSGRSGNAFTYMFSIQAFDDYRGGIWPARERYQVVVLFDRKVRKPELTCSVTKVTMLEVAY